MKYESYLKFGKRPVSRASQNYGIIFEKEPSPRILDIPVLYLRTIHNAIINNFKTGYTENRLLTI
jgi:hypothetical protein